MRAIVYKSYISIFTVVVNTRKALLFLGLLGMFLFVGCTNQNGAQNPQPVSKTPMDGCWGIYNTDGTLVQILTIGSGSAYVSDIGTDSRAFVASVQSDGTDYYMSGKTSSGENVKYKYNKDEDAIETDFNGGKLFPRIDCSARISKPITTYACPDGTVVTNLSDCQAVPTASPPIISPQVKLTIVQFHEITITNSTQPYYDLTSDKIKALGRGYHCYLGANSVPSGKRLLLIEYTYSNNDKSPHAVDSSTIKLLDQDGKTYVPKTPYTQIASGMYGSTDCSEFPFLSGAKYSLNPDESSDSIKWLFVIPSDSAPKALIYDTDDQSGLSVLLNSSQ